MKNSLFLAALFGLVVATQAGCYRTRIEMGGGTLATQKAHGEQRTDARWSDGGFYHGLILGLVDLSGPIRLDEVCPRGTSAIEQETSFLDGFLRFLTSGIYTPQEVKVVCAE